MNYDAMGAVPMGYAPRVGAMPGFDPRVGMAYGGYGVLPVAGPYHFDIIGQRQAAMARMGVEDEKAAEEGGVWNWLQKDGLLGVKRLYWLGGAAAVGLTWLAWSKGWIGGDMATSSDFY